MEVLLTPEVGRMIGRLVRGRRTAMGERCCEASITVLAWIWASWVVGWSWVGVVGRGSSLGVLRMERGRGKKRETETETERERERRR